MSRNEVSIARTARWTRWLVMAILAVTIAMQLAAVLLPDQPHIQFHRMRSTEPFGRWLSAAHSLLIVFALVQLVLLLKELEGRAFFSPGVTRRLKNFALLSLLAILTGAVLSPMLSIFLSSCTPGGPCFRRIPIDMRALWSLVISLVFFLVARLLDEARRIDEDNRQII